VDTGPADGRLIAVIESIYDAASDPLRWPQALKAIADQFGDAGALLMWRRADNSYATIVSPDLVEAQRDYEANGWMMRDTGALRATERGYFFSGHPYATRHLCSEQEIDTDSFFVQFRIRHGLGPFAGVAVSPDAEIGVLLSLQGKVGRRDYSDAELDLLSRIGRHVEKSLRLTIRLIDAELAKFGLGDALARLGIGVFVLDSLGRVVFCNPAGQALLGGDLQIARDRLRIRTGASGAAIDDMIALAARDDHRHVVADPKPILVSSGTTSRLVVYLLPISPQASPAQMLFSDARTMVLAIQQKLDEPADPAVVRDVLGLTLGEARVAALVGAGLPPRDAANRLGIAEDTARNVLKRVFQKVGISRQSELVGLLARLVLR